MGVPILVLGESGTGKSTSLRNFKKGDIAVVNVAGKPLPFKGSFENISGTVNYRNISQFIKSTKAKSIVVDDAQYIMSFQYMRRIKENGWDKFNELQSDFFNLIDLVKDLPDDVIVYFLSHLETKEDGRQKIKTIGKMLDEKITIEGMFTVVLKTYTADGKYYFLTQNSGNDTTKSPMGMFPAYAIDNDLKYVDDKIRNYYELGEYLSDEEMKEIDEAAAKVDIIKDEVEGKKRRSARGKKDDAGNEEDDGAGERVSAGNTGRTRRSRNEAAENEQQSADAESETSESTGRRRKRATADNAGESAVDGADRDDNSATTSDGNDEESALETQGDNGTSRRRNRRSVGESMADERAAVERANAQKISQAGLEEAGDAEEVPYEDVKEPELMNPPRRKRRGADSAENPSQTDATAASDQTATVQTTSEDPVPEDAPRRRRRRG